jgi:hypothetical protein
VRAYLAGPMTGYPGNNYPAFDNAAEKLRQLGWTIISPAEMSRQMGIDGTREVAPVEYQTCLHDDILAVLRAEAVIVLPGWENSKGARLEVLIAQTCGKDVYEYVEHSDSIDIVRVHDQLATHIVE